MGWPQCPKDTWHSTFSAVKAGTFIPGNGSLDGMHYDVKGNLWAPLAGLGGIIQIDLRGIILGFELIRTSLLSSLYPPGDPDQLLAAAGQLINILARCEQDRL
jgi:hypothetical protein